jgi:FkbM family methyltransferase
MESSRNGLKKHLFVVGDKSFAIFNDASDTLLSWSLEHEHTWEPWQIALYARLLRSDSICLDIGANIGTSAISMANRCPSGRVYSFEPIPHTFDILNMNVISSGLTNITTFPIAISDTEKTIEIAYDPKLLGNAHQISGDTVTEGSVAVVRTMGLDNWRLTQNVPVVDLIKVDVEGWEREVIQGGQTTLRDRRVVAIFEFAVGPQRTAGGVPFPDAQKDVKFFCQLISIFENVFLIGRNHRLYPVKSYAELRCLMMAGYPVEDLLCCHEVPDSIRDLIELPGFGTARVTANEKVLAAVVNQHGDGWADRQKYSDWTGSGMLLAATSPMSISIEFDGILSAHSKRSSHHILVAHGNEVKFVEVTDKAAQAWLDLPLGPQWIFVEADYYIEALTYFGNPSDKRHIGFRFSLPVLKTLSASAPV